MNLDARPVIAAIAGPNGAGKSTFYAAHLSQCGLRFVNADELARELDLDPYDAAELARHVRDELVRLRESFVFETVFSDPVGSKLDFLREAAAVGYSVVLCFIGLRDAAQCEERVAMRVLQGGHDVGSDKLAQRFPRSLANLERAMRELPHVLVFDNSDLRQPFRKLVELQQGRVLERHPPLPAWLRLPP